MPCVARGQGTHTDAGNKWQYVGFLFFFLVFYTLVFHLML